MNYKDTRIDIYNRVAMLHEAGHAVIAMHYGKHVFSYGIEPIPHCLPASLFMNNHDKGVLMCAGAAMCKLVYGVEWGGECSDYPMARTLGDLDEFKVEAEILCAKYISEAKYLVETRMGKEPWSRYMDEVPDMTEGSPIYSACVRAADRAILPRWAHRLMSRWARWQINNPEKAAKI